jgi:hypothetical protein
VTPAERPPHTASRADDACDCRCTCGSLLARLVPGGVEVKCRRCKRTLVVPLAGGPEPAVAQRTRALPLREAG